MIDTVSRRKTEIPTERGWYYARIPKHPMLPGHEQNPEPVYCDTREQQTAFGFTWFSFEANLRGTWIKLDAFDWFGPVPACKEET